MLTYITNKTNKHLTPEQLNSFITRYYARENLKDLTREFDLGNFHAETLPRVLIEGHPSFQHNCPCGIGKIAYKFKGRSLIKEGGFLFDEIKDYPLYLIEGKCTVCGHTPDLRYCSCSYCAEIKKREYELENLEKTKALEVFFREKRELVSLEGLDIRELTLLYALCLPHINLLGSKLKVAPDFCLSNTTNTFPRHLQLEIFIDFYRKNILSISPSSPLNAFHFNTSNEITSFYLDKLIFTLNVKHWQEIENFPNIIQEKDRSALLSLDQEILAMEAIEYLDYQATKLGIPFSVNDKIKVLIPQMLQKFKLGQVYSLIYKSSKDMSYKIQSSTMHPKHAFNYLVSMLENNFLTATDRKWDIQEFQKPAGCTNSIIRGVIEDFLFVHTPD